MTRGGERRSRGQREGGAAAVEFALVLPLLIALLFGILQFGWYFFVANNASSAAREGARRVVVGDCWGSGTFQTFVQGQSLALTSATYTPGDLASPSVKIGDQVTVKVVADGAILDFIPWGASGGQVTREFTARLEDKTAGSCS